MREIKFNSLIDKSIGRTILILFKPFSLKKWLLLLFIAYLTGAMTFSGPSGGANHLKEKKAEAAAQEGRTPDTLKEFLAKSGVAVTLTSALLLLTFILCLTLLFSWLSARFKFIWFNAIAQNDASIKEPFKRYEKEGNSLFRFYLLSGFVALALFALLIWWGFAAANALGAFEKGFQWSLAAALAIFAKPVIVLIIEIILMVILSACIDHFIVTIMALEHCLFYDGWQKFVTVFKQNQKDFFLYFLVMIAAAIAAGIAMTIMAIPCLLLLLIAGVIVFGLPYLTLVVLLKARLAYIVFAVLAGIPSAAVGILLFMSIPLPFAVFFRNLSLYFLSSLNCDYVLLPLTGQNEHEQKDNQKTAG